MRKVMNIGALVLDQKLQSRTEIDEATVTEYAENILGGADFPPVTVYFCGITYWLADGYHRYHAHKRAEKVSILCEVVNGTFRDAVLYSTSVNATHGMRRTNADKRKSVMTLLEDDQWAKMSNAEIAKHCTVSASLVSNLRTATGTQNTETVTYKTPTGKTMTKAKAPGRVAKEPEIKEPEKQEPSDAYDPRDELIEHLTKENDDLTMNLALAHLGGTEQEQTEARETVNALREEVRVLKIELAAVKQSRDTYQSENQQLKQQITMQQRQLKKQ